MMAFYKANLLRLPCVKGNYDEMLPVAEKMRRNWFGFKEVCERR